jgi:hypothetical protein
VAKTGNEFGYALGIATLGSIGTVVYHIQIAEAIPDGIPADVPTIRVGPGPSALAPDTTVASLVTRHHIRWVGRTHDRHVRMHGSAGKGWEPSNHGRRDRTAMATAQSTGPRRAP